MFIQLLHRFQIENRVEDEFVSKKLKHRINPYHGVYAFNRLNRRMKSLHKHFFQIYFSACEFQQLRLGCVRSRHLVNISGENDV